MTFFVVLLLAAAVVVYVAAPLFRRSDPGSERVAAHLSERRELQSRHDMVLAALKDLEDDRATDKIGEADYDDMKARLSTRAIEVMKQLDGLAEIQIGHAPGLGQRQGSATPR